MNILIDMNLSPRWKSTLQAAGIEVVHWSEVGDIGAADSVLASYALSNGLIVVHGELQIMT